MEQSEVRFTGRDGTGWVHVHVDGGGVVVGVDTDPARTDPTGFGAAVVAAHEAACVARLAAGPPAADVAVGRPHPVAVGSVDQVLRLGADLREYALRLAEHRERLVSGTGGEVTAWLRGDRLVAVEVDTPVLPAGVGHSVARALDGAARRRAHDGLALLDGCPELSAVLR